MIFRLIPLALVALASFGYLSDTLLRLSAERERFPLGRRVIAAAWLGLVAWTMVFAWQLAGRTLLGFVVFAFFSLCFLSFAALVQLALLDGAVDAEQENARRAFDAFSLGRPRIRL